MRSVRQLNLASYQRRATVRGYSRFTKLHQPEISIFDQHRQDLAGADVLDLGVGAGRTSPHLDEVAGTYLGVDYASAMIEACRVRFPSINFMVGDATDLALDNNTFDVVVFSEQGIDTMTHGARLQILAETRRVLRPGGLFIFSVHNRDYAKKVAIVEISRRPRLRWPLDALKGLCSYMLVRGGQSSCHEYALRSDPLAGFGCLTYFIDKMSQFQQLRTAGFVEVALYDALGEPTEAEVFDRDHPFFYVTCRSR